MDGFQLRMPGLASDGEGAMSQAASESTGFLRGSTLKDTQANRALFPKSTSQRIFESSAVTEKAYFADKKTLLFNGEVRSVLKELIAAGMKVDCIVTSPPFYGQRDYEVADQIGLEDHPSKFIDALVEVFCLCGELLRETGSMWVNLGDTYWSGKGAHKSNEIKQGARRFGVRPQDRSGDGLWARPKQQLLIPHRFAISMQDAGWIVRNDNVWVKPNPIPDQVRDRCSMSHEYVFHFTKARWYYFDKSKVARTAGTGTKLPPLDTWTIPPAKGNGRHKASFSEELVRIPILSTCHKRGIVLDPFAGTGTSLIYARRLGLRSIGIDIKEEYCEMALAGLQQVGD